MFIALYKIELLMNLKLSSKFAVKSYKKDKKVIFFIYETLRFILLIYLVTPTVNANSFRKKRKSHTTTYYLQR